MGNQGKASKRKSAPKKVSVTDVKFADGLIARGEAVPKLEGKSLPAGATHWLVMDDGEKKVKRARFSAR